VSVPAEKPFASRAADLVRRLGSDFDGEILATHSALKRLLATRGLSFTDLGSDLEKLATGGLAEEELKRVFEAGRQKGRAEMERESAEAQGVLGLRPDGSKNWEAIALYCQREKDRLKEDQHRKFIDDMAARMTCGGREPTERQATYLLSLFRQLGGKIT
jgi:hypothetical protein